MKYNTGLKIISRKANMNRNCNGQNKNRQMQIIINKTLYRKIKIEQHESHSKPGVSSFFPICDTCSIWFTISHNCQTYRWIWTLWPMLSLVFKCSWWKQNKASKVIIYLFIHGISIWLPVTNVLRVPFSRYIKCRMLVFILSHFIYM